MRMKRYQFLLIDLDDTLLDFDADMTMAFEKLYEHCGFESVRPYTPAMLEIYEKHNVNWWKKFEAGECTKPELFRNRFVDFLKETGFSGDPDEMNAAYFGFLGQGGAAYPGALELLERLSRTYAVYIITNGYALSAKTRMEHAGVTPYIRGYFVSESIGCAKPDVRYFDYVAAHIPGFQKEKALVIGDSLGSDIQGANNAGLDSLWYTSSWEDPAQASCTYRAGSYREILEILT